MFQGRVLCCSAAAVLLLGATAAEAARWYVNGSLSTNGNGTSWNTAFNNLQTAITFSGQNDEIWVAAGTYYPSVESCPSGSCGSNPRNKTFRLKNGVRIYGGFLGVSAETLLSQRNPELNETILDGRVDPNNPQLDVYHVVTAHEVGPGTMLNGFTITGGNAIGGPSAPVFSGAGGGLLASFYDYNEQAYSNPQIVRCRFIDNTSENGGAGVLVDWDRSASNNPPAQFVNCLFADNVAYGGGAGGAYVFAGKADFTNCVFVNNFAGNGDGSGLAVYCSVFAAGASGGCPTPLARVTNCTFVNNGTLAQGEDGFGAYADSRANPALVVTNSIFWDNTTAGLDSRDPNGLVVTYSDIQGSFTWPGTGNINADPLFCDEGAGILRLSDSSPCIDAGLDCERPQRCGRCQ